MKILFVFFLSILSGTPSTTDPDYLLGKFNPADDSRFVKLRGDHTSGSAVGGYLRKEAYEAFIRMAEAARKEGIHFVIVSATRNFESQKKIWENKWNGNTIVEGKNLSTVKDPVQRARIILRYSSMPGSSRHHWGSDMDLNSLENSYFLSGPGLKLYQWMKEHAAEYGFCQPYTSKENGRTGYEEEKWHWSYRPLAEQFLKEYVLDIHDEDITGFRGSETAASLKIVEEFVQGVACQ